MKWIYLQQILSLLKKKWWLGGVISIISVCFCVFIAEIKIENNKNIELQVIKDTEEFEENLKIYDDLIAEVEASLAANKTAIDDLERYVGNSIFMNLDSQKINVSGVQYELMAEDYREIMNQIITYVNDGSLLGDIAEHYPMVPTEYISEIITCDTAENLISISVMHYDADASAELIGIIEQCLVENVNVLAETLNGFSLEKVGSYNYAQASEEVLSKQNDKRSYIWSYHNTHSELEKKLLDQKISRSNFIDNNKPYYNAASPKKIFVFHIIIGLISGILLTVVIGIVWLIIDDRIRSEQELHLLKINSLGKILDNEDKGLFESIDFIRYAMEKYNLSKIMFCKVGEFDINCNVLDIYFEKLKSADSRIVYGDSVTDNPMDLKKLIASQGCVLLLKLGTSTRMQVQECLELCEKYNILVMGSLIKFD